MVLDMSENDLTPETQSFCCIYGRNLCCKNKRDRNNNITQYNCVTEYMPINRIIIPIVCPIYILDIG
jgi:hypothetical protein